MNRRTNVAFHVPLRILIGLQGFRVLPEILLDLAFREGLAPIQMTWPGIHVLTALTLQWLNAAASSERRGMKRPRGFCIQ